MPPKLAEVELEKLYQRAIDDPLSITRADNNVLQQWPPPEEEDRICVEKTGSTRAQLVTKAVATPDDLTRAEAAILHHTRGVRFDEPGKSFDATEPPRLRELRHKARREIWEVSSEEHKKAFMNGLNRWMAI
jgi:hypothetical protein